MLDLSLNLCSDPKKNKEHVTLNMKFIQYIALLFVSNKYWTELLPQKNWFLVEQLQTRG